MTRRSYDRRCARSCRNLGSVSSPQHPCQPGAASRTVSGSLPTSMRRHGISPSYVEKVLIRRRADAGGVRIRGQRGSGGATSCRVFGSPVHANWPYTSHPCSLARGDRQDSHRRRAGGERAGDDLLNATISGSWPSASRIATRPTRRRTVRARLLPRSCSGGQLIQWAAVTERHHHGRWSTSSNARFTKLKTHQALVTTRTQTISTFSPRGRACHRRRRFPSTVVSKFFDCGSIKSGQPMWARRRTVPEYRKTMTLRLPSLRS